MTTDAPTLDQVLDLATRLPPADQVRLIARLAPQIERVLEDAPLRPMESDMDPHAILAEIREAFRAQGPVSPSMSEQLEVDRQARDAALRGEV